MQSVRALVVSLIILLFVPVPAVVAGDATQPLPVTTFWVHNQEAANDQFMSPEQHDSRSRGSNGAGTQTGTSAFPTVWEISLDPGLAEDLELDPDRNVELTVFLGANLGAGAVNVDSTLTHGDQVVAVGEPKQVVFALAQVTSSYTEISWSMSPELSTLSAGEDLVLTVTAEGPRTQIFMGMADNRGHSNLVLPLEE